MKTYLTYGSAMTGGSFVLVLVLYIFGFHSDAAKISTAQWIQGVLGLGIGIACIVLGTKARRESVPAEEEFGYGAALGAGVMIALFSALLSLVTNYVYFHFVNPGMTDLIMQAQIAKWEAAGMSSARIEQAEGIMRKMMNPAVQAAFGFGAGMIFGTLISLVTAAFLKRPSTDGLKSVS